MIGFDTNVLLRALLNDDPAQSSLAREALSGLNEQREGYVSKGVLLELYWVCDRLYRMPRQVIGRTFRALMEVTWLTFEDFEAFVRALHRYETQSADFSDALIAESNKEHGCTVTITFDRKAAKTVPGMELLA